MKNSSRYTSVCQSKMNNIMSLQGQSDVCRVCLRNDIVKEKKGLSLFQNLQDSLISEHILSICNVKIKEGDGLPTKICPDCLIELEAAVNFRLKCQTSDTILHSKKLENSVSYGVKIEFNSDYIKEEKIEEEVSIPIEAEYLEDGFIMEGTDAFIKTEGKPSKAIDPKLICDDCGRSFPSKCKIRVHWKKVHMRESLICKICKRAFKSYKAYNRHVKDKPKACLAMKNVRVEGTGKSRLYLCKDCPYTSKRNKDMQSHLVLHSGERPFKCLSCDRYFTQLSAMHGHMERVHGVYKVEITCQYCGKFVRGRHAVYKHLQKHATAGVQCNVCKKVFSSKSTLRTHMVRHSGVKKYTCEKCATAFYTLAELCNHKRTKHSNTEIWYKCDLCEYKAQKSYSIKKHQAKHTANNFSCETCGIFVDSAEKLALHQPRHSDSEKKFQCPHCEKKFYKKDSINRHIKAKHKCALFINRPVLVKNEENHDNEFEKTIEVTPAGVQIKTLSTSMK